MLLETGRGDEALLAEQSAILVNGMRGSLMQRKVRVCGLVANPELNSLVGTVVSGTLFLGSR